MRLASGQPSRYSAGGYPPSVQHDRGVFDLPDEVKRQYPLAGNAGWAKRRFGRRPAPGSKESYQITRPLMAGRWPSDRELPAFQQTMLGFESQCWQLGMKISPALL